MTIHEPLTDARCLAWETLIAVEEGAFADAELGRRLREASLAARDRALATRLVYGTLAWQGLLDYIVTTVGRSPEQLDVPIRALLRLAIFQLVKLARVPDFAVVDTAVELSKRFRHGAAAGLVNAVLRRFLRQHKRVALPRRGSDVAAYLATALSHPRWLVELWMGELGVTETEALLGANNEPAPTVLRVNRLRGDRGSVLESLRGGGATARPTIFSPDGIMLESAGDPSALAGYADGSFTSQGEASQLVAYMVGARPGDQLLDACAAPGGKATHLGELLGDVGRVVAVDQNEPALAYLGRATRRLGLGCVDVLRADSARLPIADGRSFDVVLVDAPCSGLGTLRQHPEIRWRRQPHDLAEMAAVQARLLAQLASRVRAGGSLVYATCTIASAENERVVEQFLAASRDFDLDDPSRWLPDAARGLLDGRGFLRTFPHRDGLDGFFAARLKRRREVRMVSS